jgi:hypothetical protein
MIVYLGVRVWTMELGYGTNTEGDKQMTVLQPSPIPVSGVSHRVFTISANSKAVSDVSKCPLPADKFKLPNLDFGICHRPAALHVSSDSGHHLASAWSGRSGLGARPPYVHFLRCLSQANGSNYPKPSRC